MSKDIISGTQVFQATLPKQSMKSSYIKFLSMGFLSDTLLAAFIS
jgi:hypothetical protein